MNPSTDEVAVFIQKRQLERQERHELEAKVVALTARNNELEEEVKYLGKKIQKATIALSTEMERPNNDNEKYDDDNRCTNEAGEEVSNDDDDEGDEGEAEEETQQEVFPFNGKMYGSYLEMRAAKLERNKKVLDQIGLPPLAEGLTTTSTKRKAPPVAEMAILSHKALRPLKALSDGDNTTVIEQLQTSKAVVDDDDNRHAKNFGVDDADDDVDEEEKTDDASTSIKRKAPPLAESKLRSCKEPLVRANDVVFGNGPYKNHDGNKTYRSKVKEIIDGYKSQPHYYKKKFVEDFVDSYWNQRVNDDLRFFKCDKETNMKPSPISKEVLVSYTLKYIQDKLKTWGK